MFEELGFKKVIKWVGALLVCVILFNALDWNQYGYYKVKQSLFTGKMTYHTNTGPFLKAWGTIHEISLSEPIFMSSDKYDGGSGSYTDAIEVLFPDGKADISVEIRYELSIQPQHMAELQRMFKGNDAIAAMVRKQVLEAVKNTGPLMNSEAAYADRRAEFKRLAEEQALNGLYESVVTETRTADETGNFTITKHYDVMRDENGKPVIASASTLAKFGIQFVNFNITDFDFDEEITGLIKARKMAQKAAQDAITAKADGEARMATAKADQEVLKITEVTQAEKIRAVEVLNAKRKFEVAEFAKKEAYEKAEATIANGRAVAEANKLLVDAGLTPIERAMIDKDTAIGVAAELAKVQFPEMLVIGGGGAGEGVVDPFKAVGLKSFMDIARDVAQNGVTAPKATKSPK